MRYAILLFAILLSSFVTHNNVKIIYTAELEGVTIKPQEPTKDDILLLAKLINSEAKWESIEGKIAVGQVVLNRIKSQRFSYATNLEKAIYRKGQFDGIKTKYFKEVPNLESRKAARLVLIGRKVLPSNCFFYANEKASTDKSWIRYLKKKSTDTITIQNHTFYILK